MLEPVLEPMLQALTLALGLPVRPLADLRVETRRAVLEALGSANAPAPVTAAGGRYLATRYSRERAAVIVLGPYALASAGDRPSGGPSPAAIVDQAWEERAAAALERAAKGLRQAAEQEVQRLELASQLEVVSHSVLAVTSALDLETVLRRIVDLARELAGARYAALGLLEDDGTVQSFVTSGYGMEGSDSLDGFTRGLDLALTEGGTDRQANLPEHPGSIALAVPITVRGRGLGTLYLSEKLIGAEFTEADAHLVEVLARHAAVAIENAQLYQAVEEQKQRLQLLLDQMPEAVVVLDSTPERVSLVNRETSRLLGWNVEPPISLEEFFARNPRLYEDGSPVPVDQIHVVRALRRGEVVERNEIRLLRPEGRTLSLLVNAAPLVSLSGKILGAVAVFQDISRIKDAEQLKDDFLSLVSHELRTPLTTIRGGAALLLRDWQQLDAEVRGAILSDISSESQRLAMLIENMVQLTSIRAGRLGLQPEPVLLAGLVERVATAVHEMAPSEPVAVLLEPQLVAEADPALVEQTLRILLHNALKYAPGSPIEITGCRQNDRIVLGVRDHGPGIDEAELPHVFERFHRGAGNSVPGLGLGLYLARHLVEVSAGDIWIESPQDGGVRVLFTLPAFDLEPQE